MINDEVIQLLKKIDTKLGLILGNQVIEKHNNVKDQVAKLSKSDLEYTDIADILGISQSHAAKELSKIKKVKKWMMNNSRKYLRSLIRFMQLLQFRV